MARSSFGSVRKRPDTGRWQARYQDSGGRQHSSTFGTKAEAASWLRLQAADRETGSWVDPRAGKVTFATWSTHWRSTVVDLRESTRYRDFGYVDRYLVPVFGPAELSSIETEAVQAWVSTMIANGLSAATTVKAAQILGKIMRAAVAAKRLPASPVDGVKLPRVEVEEMRFLTPEEVWRLHDVIDARYRGVVLLGAYGGLRAGEMFALTVGRVNPLRAVVQVRENVVEVQGRNVLGLTKTRAGRRDVPVPGFVLEAMGVDGRPPTGLVFPAPKGGHISRSSWRTRFWLPAVSKAGLDGLRLHDLRHTAVALWIEAGANPIEIARRAGHSSASVVLDRYGHLMPWAEDRVTAALEKLGRPDVAPVEPFRLDGARFDDRASTSHKVVPPL